ncbi:hypothetical protein HDU67_006774 [Dinochytrium kinnereticum]|nr:hypothetical protein HDU67_006774 [Dinochytrium kinnereticum]
MALLHVLKSRIAQAISAKDRRAWLMAALMITTFISVSTLIGQFVYSESDSNPQKPYRPGKRAGMAIPLSSFSSLDGAESYYSDEEMVGVAPEGWSKRVQGLMKETYSNGNLAIPHSPAIFHRTNASTITEERRWWKSRMDYRETAFITSANNATFPFIRNMVCSLINSAPELLENLVVWALDETVVKRLLEFRKELLAGSFVDPLGRSEGNMKRHHWKSPLGIYFDADKTTTPNMTSGVVNTKTYYGIMDMRRDFYVHLLDDIGINYLFTDADVHYSANPFEDLNLPFGIPDDEKRSGIAHQLPSSVEDFYRDYPDIIYSTDARKPYHYLADPYEGGKRTPKICGGFFFARSNARTVQLYRTIRDAKINDQWGVDDLLNNHFPTVLVDPLPAGLEKRKLNPKSVEIGKRVEGWSWSDPIRIRVLSQAAYTNALPEWAKPGTRGPTYDELVKELRERGEREVLFHPNYWADKYAPYFRIHVFTDNKTWIFEQLNMWKVQDGRCYL